MSLQSILPQPLRHLFSDATNILILTQEGIAHQQCANTINVSFEQGEPCTLNIDFTQKCLADLTILYLSNDKPIHLKAEIHLKESAQIKLFEYVYGTSKHAVNLDIDTILHRNANLTYSTLSTLEKDTPTMIKRQSILHRDANLLAVHAAFSDALTHQEHHIKLMGQYARATAKVVALTNQTQEALFKTIIEHLAPMTEGMIEHYGVANDASVLLFEGVGHIHKDMKRSIARQSNKGLIIGKDARLDANPLLIIDEFDVEAGHGAAIGKIDENQLYYLMSRGLSRKQAERLIINGFLAPIKATITNEQLTQHIETLLEEKTK